MLHSWSILFYLMVLSYTFVLAGMGVDALTIITTSICLFVLALCSTAKRYQANAFSVLLAFTTVFYFVLPLAFMLTLGDNYVFGADKYEVSTRATAHIQANTISISVLFFTICWFSLWAGMMFCKRRVRNLAQTNRYFITPKLIIVFGLLTFGINVFEQLSLFEQLQKSGLYTQSIGSFVFSRNAFLCVAGISLFHYINSTEDYRKFLPVAMVIFIFFTAFQTYSGSKASFVQIGVIFVLLPLCLASGYENSKSIFFNKTCLILIAMFLLFSFPIMESYRATIMSNREFNLSDVWFEEDRWNFSYSIQKISDFIYRLAQGGIDHLILLSDQYLNFEHLNSRIYYIFYGLKSTVNLVLPGSPFPEAQIGLGQYFGQVAILENSSGDPIVADFSIMANYNTGSYTLFGESIIAFGFFAPVFLFLFSSSLSYIFYLSRYSALRVLLLFFFLHALTSYGFDSVIGNSFHTLLSITFLFVFAGCIKLLGNSNFNGRL